MKVSVVLCHPPEAGNFNMIESWYPDEATEAKHTIVMSQDALQPVISHSMALHDSLFGRSVRLKAVP